MDFLARLVGPDAARQFRERSAATSAATQTPPKAAGSAPSSAMGAGPPGSPPAPRSIAGAPQTDAVDLATFAVSDFPTSILATAAETAPPLLAAFANRPALLAAIVFSEALAPPVALR